MTEMPRNAFKHALAAGKLQIGLWSSLCSNIAAEIISDSAASTGSCSTPSIRPTKSPIWSSQLQAIQAGTATPIIRPAWNDAVLAKRALDIGAQSLLFPYVQNAEEAQARGRFDALSAAGHSRRVGGGARQPLWPHARLSDQGQ